MATTIQANDEVKQSVLGWWTGTGVERLAEDGTRFKLVLTKAEQAWFRKHTGREFDVTG